MEMRAAAVQLNSTADKARNLATAERLVRAAARGGRAGRSCRRSGTCSPTPPRCWRAPSPRRADDRRRQLLGARAGDPPVAGSIAERVEGHEKAFNTSTLIGPDGELEAALPQDPHVRRRRGRRGVSRVGARGARRRAGAARRRGLEGVTLGLTVCYDLRFPELYRILAVRGATVITSPPRSPSTPARITGRSCCGLARSRTRPSWLPRTRSARRRRTTAPTDAR